MWDRAGWFVFAALFWCSIDLGMGTSRADDVQVNTYTPSGQNVASVSLDADGDFVVAWSSLGSPGSDSLSTSVQGQRFASDGSLVGGQFQVNTYTSSAQLSTAVAVDADGDFLVVWQSFGSSGTDSLGASIQGQRFASNGSTVGSEFQVNTYTTSDQRSPAVALDADGDAVVVWQSDGGATDTSLTSIQGQRYASDGSAVGGQFQINTLTPNAQSYPSVALDDVGDFVVVWQSSGSSGTDSSSFSIQGQRYASDGSLIGGQFQVNTYSTNSQDNPSVTLDMDGDFTVVWQSVGSSGSDPGSSVQGQRYASNGSTVGGEFQINTYTPSTLSNPSVATDADGDFVVVWDSTGSSSTDSSSYSVQGRRYASDGSAIGDEFQVNTYTTNYQFRPAVSSDATGDFVIVWDSYGSSGTDTSGSSIQKTGTGFVPVELTSFSIE